MIGVRLEGGLGNQLFQYAAARSLAIRYGTQVVADRSAFGIKKKSITAREYELSVFNCSIRPFKSSLLNFTKFAKHASWLFNLFSPWSVLVEKGEQFPRAPRPDEIEGGSVWYAKAQSLI
jgi:hypothetical protein